MTTSSDCSSTTNLGPGFTNSSVCITFGGGPGPTCDPNDDLLAFNLDTTSTTCFTATGASCPAPRRLLAAQAGTTNAAGVPGCVTATIGGGPGFDQAQFSRPIGTTWTFFQFLIGCSCS